MYPTSSLPEPDSEAQAISHGLMAVIHDELERAGGWLPFSRYMELALYAPGLGYYAAGSRKLGADGDFITAPEISPLFGRCLARQCAQVLQILGEGDILEFGAGTGRMAAEILLTLDRLGTLPGAYHILEPSPDLRERQRSQLSALPLELRGRVRWLDSLPEAGSFRGVMLGNEVLDAMPVRVFRWTGEAVMERGIAMEQGRGLCWQDRPADPGLSDQVRALHASVGNGWRPGHVSELNPGLDAWMRSVSASLSAGLLMLIDYGYPRHEYYSAERYMGTLIAHYRHRVLEEPLYWPGLLDITANVDFTALAEAADAQGLDLLAYTSQSWFLMSTGLEQEFAACDPKSVRDQMELARQVRMLTLPGEMGERFQVMLLGRGLNQPLLGANGRDLRHRLWASPQPVPDRN